MPKKILLMDAFSTIHVGNGALLENTMLLCKKAYGDDCNISIISTDTKTNEIKYDKNILYEYIFKYKRGSKKTYKILWFLKSTFFMISHIVNYYTFKLPLEKIAYTKEQKRTLKAMDEADICISLVGEAMNHTTYQSLPFWLFSYWLTITKGKKFILFPQSVGPFKRKWEEKIIFMALKDAKLLIGRDKPSYEKLIEIGFNKNQIMFVPDVAIQQQRGNADIHYYFKNREKKVIGITISNPPTKELGKEVDFIKEIVPQINRLNNEKYKILIMPSNYLVDKISDDYKLCLDLKEVLKENFEVSILNNRAYFPDEYSALLAQLELFISTRMHVSILATTMYTPTIAINTQHKIRGYMKNIHMEHFCLDYEELNTIYKLVDEMIVNRVEIVNKLKQENLNLKKEHNKMIEVLKNIVE